MKLRSGLNVERERSTKPPTAHATVNDKPPLSRKHIAPTSRNSGQQMPKLSNGSERCVQHLAQHRVLAHLDKVLAHADKVLEHSVDVKKKLQEEERERALLAKQLSQVREQSAKQKVSQTIKNQLSALEITHAAKCQEVVVVKTRLREIKKQLEEKKREYTQLENELSEAKKPATQRPIPLDLQNELSVLKRTHTATCQELVTVKAQLAASQDAASLRDAMQTHSEAIAAVTNKLDAAQSQLTTTNKHIVNCTRCIERSQAESVSVVTSLKNEFSSFRNEAQKQKTTAPDQTQPLDNSSAKKRKTCTTRDDDVTIAPPKSRRKPDEVSMWPDLHLDTDLSVDHLRILATLCSYQRVFGVDCKRLERRLQNTTMGVSIANLDSKLGQLVAMGYLKIRMGNPKIYSFASKKVRQFLNSLLEPLLKPASVFKAPPFVVPSILLEKIRTMSVMGPVDWETGLQVCTMLSRRPDIVFDSAAMLPCRRAGAECRVMWEGCGITHSTIRSCLHGMRAAGKIDIVSETSTDTAQPTPRYVCKHVSLFAELRRIESIFIRLSIVRNTCVPQFFKYI